MLINNIQWAFALNNIHQHNAQNGKLSLENALIIHVQIQTSESNTFKVTVTVEKEVNVTVKVNSDSERR